MPWTQQDRDQALDMKIIRACNALIECKAQTARQRADLSTKRTRLLRQYDSVKEEWYELMRAYRRRNNNIGKNNASAYHQACREAFAPTVIPAFAAARQAQLCHYLHVMSAEDNQFYQMRDQVEDLTKFMSNCGSELIDDQAASEKVMLNAVVDIKMEIHTLMARMGEVEVQQKRITKFAKSLDSINSEENKVVSQCNDPSKEQRVEDVASLSATLCNEHSSAQDENEESLQTEHATAKDSTGVMNGSTAENSTDSDAHHDGNIQDDDIESVRLMQSPSSSQATSNTAIAC